MLSLKEKRSSAPCHHRIFDSSAGTRRARASTHLTQEQVMPGRWQTVPVCTGMRYPLQTRAELQVRRNVASSSLEHIASLSAGATCSIICLSSLSQHIFPPPLQATSWLPAGWMICLRRHRPPPPLWALSLGIIQNMRVAENRE